MLHRCNDPLSLHSPDEGPHELTSQVWVLPREGLEATSTERGTDDLYIWTEKHVRSLDGELLCYRLRVPPRDLRVEAGGDGEKRRELSALARLVGRVGVVALRPIVHRQPDITVLNEACVAAARLRNPLQQGSFPPRGHRLQGFARSLLGVVPLAGHLGQPVLLQLAHFLPALQRLVLHGGDVENSRVFRLQFGHLVACATQHGLVVVIRIIAINTGHAYFQCSPPGHVAPVGRSRVDCLRTVCALDAFFLALRCRRHLLFSLNRTNKACPICENDTWKSEARTFTMRCI
mmetsp:Transcript_99732/g.260019  ORF Transcript_99732/g.260019 Transcript_99732/m.260019 type:complete len:290 (+) Transcript_99732:1651-2520(+)